jgi:hypothetical protein
MNFLERRKLWALEFTKLWELTGRHYNSANERIIFNDGTITVADIEAALVEAYEEHRANAKESNHEIQ